MIPKPGARVTVTYGRPFEVAEGEAVWRQGCADADRAGWARSRERWNDAAGRHSPGDALAVDQPAARRAAGAAGAPAGVRALARSHGRPRGLAYRRGWLAVRDLPLPAVAVGNLTVGGSGKTPIAIWIARYYVERGAARDLAARATASDEILVHQHDVPEAIVVADPDRYSGRGASAGQRGAGAGAGRRVSAPRRAPRSQHRGLERRDDPGGPLDAAGGTVAGGLERARPGGRRHRDPQASRRPKRRSPWPRSRRAGRAGRWRSRSSASAACEGMVAGAGQPRAAWPASGWWRRRGSPIPEGFVAQVRATGAAVQVATWKDHHEYRDEDVAWLAHAARRADYVVVTEKDAVKLRDRWPAAAPEPLVAVLDLDVGGRRGADRRRAGASSPLWTAVTPNGDTRTAL